MDLAVEDSQLLTSSRPPPTGQDSCDPYEEIDDIKHNLTGDGNKTSNLTTGTPRKHGLLSESRRTQAISSAHEDIKTMDKSCIHDEELAPLGFEPEGSVAHSKYLENSSADLLTLLHSSDGRHSFRDFLSLSHQEGLLNCWLACYNYRSNVVTWSILQQAFNNYILKTDSCLQLSETTRLLVKEMVSSKCVDLQIVNLVERDLWSALNSEWYGKFVDSSYYCTYPKRGVSLPKRESRSKSNKVDLQTLLEGKPSQNQDHGKQRLESDHDHLNQLSSHAKPSNRQSRDCRCRNQSDNLPVPTNFIPITQMVNKTSKQTLQPEELMRQLLPKLEVIYRERASLDNDDSSSIFHTEAESSYSDGRRPFNDVSSYMSTSTGNSHSHTKQNCYETSSYHTAPSHSRLSAAGASTKSCPEHNREHSRKYKDNAKELASAVHQALRTKLHSSDLLSADSSVTSPSYQSSGRGVGSSHSHRQCCCRQPHCCNAPQDQEFDPHPPQPTKNRRIMEWMEKNAEEEGSEISYDINSMISSPSVTRKHRQPVAYNTSRHSSSSRQHPHTSHSHDKHYHDHETSKDHYSRSHHKSSRSHRRSNHNHHNTAYPESTTSGHWTASDSASSYMAPSVVSSSVPSSASRLWPETKLDFQQHNHPSYHSGSSRKSQSSTGNNSNSCKSNNSTMVTYYLEKEPIPYRSTLPVTATLGEFKKTVAKKGTFRYFFKTTSDDDNQVVYQEITDNDEILPRYQNQVVVKVVKQ